MPQQDVPRPASTTTINPSTGEVIQSYPFQTTDDLETSLSRAAKGFATWRDTSPEERAATLTRIAKVLRDREEELAKLITLEMGKTLQQARGEIEKCAVLAEWYAANGPRLIADEPTTVEDNKAYVSYLPLGSVLAVQPWNFPFWQALRAAVPIMMAGNGIVLSHSKNVTGCAYAIGEVFQQSGVPEGAFEVILIATKDIVNVLNDDRIAAVTLTGSVRAGIAIASEAGKVLKKCVLELGGSDPFIVLGDADLEACVEAAIKARYMNSGQICICGKRFILEEPIAEAFTARFVEAASKLVLGDPMQEDTFMGPMARVDLRDSLHKQVESSIKNGAKLLLGGVIPNGPGAYYPPTVLVDVKPGMAAFDEETFGPVAAITVVRDAEEAIELANRSEFGLSSSLWTRDVERGKALARRIVAGAVFLNGYSGSDPRTPIGGVKKSGYGRELSHFGIHEFVNAQLIWQDKRS